MVNDAGCEEEEDEADVGPVEELIVARADRFEREEHDDGEKNPSLRAIIIGKSASRPRRLREQATHHCPGGEAVPFPHRHENGSTEGILVDYELVEPGCDVTRGEEPDDATGPAMQDGRLRARGESAFRRARGQRAGFERRPTLSKW